MHAVRKECSSTTKLRVVFDTSASGISLNDLLLVGSTFTAISLLRFRLHHVTLAADVSKIYRAIELVPSDHDLHRFSWRPLDVPLESLHDQSYLWSLRILLLLQTCLLSRMLLTLVLTTLKLPKLLMMASLVQIPYKMPFNCKNS